MTEIPDEAVWVAARVYREFAATRPSHPDAMHAALRAARPYLQAQKVPTLEGVVPCPSDCRERAAHHHYEDEDGLRWVRRGRALSAAALPHLRVQETRVDDEEVWRSLVEREMGLRGYADEEIKAAEKHSCKEFGCEWDWNHSAWVCTDEEGHSAHPVADEYGEIAGVIGRALEALAVPAPASRPVVDREALAKAAHEFFCLKRDEPTHDLDETDYETADQIIEILALLPTEEDTKGQHGPIGVLGTDVGPFIKCSCGKNPTPKIWLEEHWAGDPETGKQLVRQFLPASEGAKGEGS